MTGTSAPASTPGEHAPAGRPSSRLSVQASPRSRPRGRSTSAAAPASSPAISVARSPASTRVRPCWRSSLGASRRRSSCRPMRRRFRSRPTRSSGWSRATSTAISTPRRAPSSSLRHGASHPSSSSSTRHSARTSTPRSSRSGFSATAPGTRSTSATSLSRTSQPSSAAPRRSSPGAGSSPSARRDEHGRPFVTRRRRLYRSLASLQRDNRRCRLCLEAGHPLGSRPVVEGHSGQRAYLLGQAPGVVEGAELRPWRGRAGQTLRRWLRLDEEAFYATFYCAAVTRCYPGRAPSGRGDRTPTPREQELCAFWREQELRLLEPQLVVTVGGLALRRLLGIGSLTEAIGKSYVLGGAIVVPLPHPSGASGRLNDPPHPAPPPQPPT